MHKDADASIPGADASIRPEPGGLSREALTCGIVGGHIPPVRSAQSPPVTLKSRAQFNRVRGGGKWTAPSFVLQALPRSGDDDASPRFGFTVSSKALTVRSAGTPVKRPGAVLRNRARRRLKEAVRLLAPCHAKPNFDYVVIGRREALHQRFADLLEDMQLAFGKVHRPPRANDGKAHPDRGRAAPAGQTRAG